MIQWYPGHMAKARKVLKDDLKLVDLVIETLDARIPDSSRNPDLNTLLEQKSRIIVLNKIDLASSSITGEWIKVFKDVFPAVKINALTGRGIDQLLGLIKVEARKINKRMNKKSRKNRDIRIMVIGIPNVGKSALINNLAGAKIARTGNKPGVTRGKQWIGIANNIQLLDTPGILWPKFDDEEVGYKLALTGAIRDKLFDEEIAAYKLIEHILKIDSSNLKNYYNITFADIEEPYDILALIGRKTGCLMSGGKVDRIRVANKLINDFQQGKLGSISLERPEVDF